MKLKHARVWRVDNTHDDPSRSIISSSTTYVLYIWVHKHTPHSQGFPIKVFFLGEIILVKEILDMFPEHSNVQTQWVNK
jgi:hypothetical protein